MDLQTLTIEQLRALQTAIRAELARRSGGSLEVRVGPALRRAASVIAGDREVTTRADGGLAVDYTANGCVSSEAWVEVEPRSIREVAQTLAE